jgi:Leucine-rich repeat (LRR) protein
LFYIWGAQLEESPYASSYIPTNGSPASRATQAGDSSGNGLSIALADLDPRVTAALGGTALMKLTLGYNNNQEIIGYTPFGALMVDSETDLQLWYQDERPQWIQELKVYDKWLTSDERQSELSGTHKYVIPFVVTGPDLNLSVTGTSSAEWHWPNGTVTTALSPGDKSGMDQYAGYWFIDSIENITEINYRGQDIQFNIGAVGYLTGLTYLQLGNTSVTGDISNLSNLTGLTYLRLGSTSVTGDISNLSNLTGLDRLHLGNTSVTGDISNLSNLTKLSGTYSWEGLQLSDTNIDTYTSTTLPAWDCYINLNNLNLSQTEVDDFLTDLDTAGGTGGVLTMAGTSTPSATGETAIDSLRAKGWTVTVEGGY